VSYYDDFDKYMGFSYGRIEVHWHFSSDGIRWVDEFVRAFSDRLQVEREGAGAFLGAVLAAVNGVKAERALAVQRYATWMEFDKWRRDLDRWQREVAERVDEQFDASLDPDTGRKKPRRYFEWRAFKQWRRDVAQAEEQAAKRARRAP